MRAGSHSGRTSGGPLARRTVVAALLLVFALTGLTGVYAAESEGEAAWLYFTERPLDDNIDQWNFTVFPADPEDDGGQRQASQKSFPTFLATWSWSLPRAPTNWTQSDGDQWEFVLFIEGLDAVYPLPELLFPPSTSLGHYEIRVEILVGTDEVAKGSINVSFLDVETGIQSYHVPVTFRATEDIMIGDAPENYRIEISVSGRGQGPESPLYLHYGSLDHPSHIDAPTYPIEGLRSLELDYLLAKECQDLILQQKSCESLQGAGNRTDGAEDGESDDENQDDETVGNGAVSRENGDEAHGNDTSGDLRTTPGPGFLLLGSAGTLLLGALWAARRIRDEAP